MVIVILSPTDQAHPPPVWRITVAVGISNISRKLQHSYSLDRFSCTVGVTNRTLKKFLF